MTMKISLHFDSHSEARLRELQVQTPSVFKLLYDTEDCGCNGVPAIQIIRQPLDTDLLIDAAPFTFVVDQQQASLFDAQMQLEANLPLPTFKLSSPSGLFSSNVRLQDLR